jgi:hypothetical protein
VLAVVGAAWRRSAGHPRVTIPIVAAVLLAFACLTTLAGAATWSSWQWRFASGADQLWLYAKPAVVFSVVLLAFALVVLWRGRGGVDSTLLEMYIIAACSVALVPNQLFRPGDHAPMAYLTPRLSVVAACVGCALLARAVRTVPQTAVLACIAVAFFAWSYSVDRRLGGVEARLGTALSSLSPGRRVVDLTKRPIALQPIHLLDRACVGRCFSYANYEPATWQFRLRAVGANPYVLHDQADVVAVENGRYVVKPDDVPLYVLRSRGGRLVVDEAQVGERLSVGQ